MPEVGKTPEVVRFGPFELAVETGELRKDGLRLGIGGQPIEVLTLLVKAPATVVSREELQRRLWPPPFYGDVEGGLNAAVNRLREFLGDSASDPKYIETVPGRGYRFIAPVIHLPGHSTDPVAAWLAKIKRPFSWIRKVLVVHSGWVIALAVTALILLIALVTVLPSIARYYNNRGVRLQQSGDLQGAIESYKRALLFRPNYAEAHYNLADVFEELPAYDKALEEYQKAIEADPKFYEAYNNLARLYIKRRKEPEAALELLERALNLNPQEPSVQYSLYKNYGWANFELHLWGQAETRLRRAIALDPSRGAAHCLLAKVLDVQGSTKAAPKEWESCAAYSGQQEVEPEWHAEAEERLNKEAQK